MRILCLLAALMSLCLGAMAGDGNRLAYVDGFCDPYYVGRDTARLVTPQWIGEEGVEAAAVLSIDDLRDPQIHETFLRPIIERLKQIDGRGPVSCMGNKIDVELPIFQQWLREGVSVEAHTYDHPCPCLQGDDFTKAKGTYDEGVDLVFTVPNSSPVAFRMPCCDSMNSMSPRFYTEVFNKTTPKGHFLQVNSSVFLLFTPEDKDLPESIVRDEQGKLRFDKYVPRDREFVNYVEDYPYPYVIGRLCWELPSAMPDDWQGFNLLGAHSPVMAGDMQKALDATVIQQGIYTLCHHAGRWIRSDQVVALVDHAVEKYGKKVKFLNFREVNERLTKNLLGGVALRAANGQDNGVRVADLNADGFMDVVIGNEKVRQTRLWSPEKNQWIVGDFPAALVQIDQEGNRHDAGVRFGILQKNGFASILVRSEEQAGVWHFDGKSWVADSQGLTGLEIDGPVATSRRGQDQGVRLYDLDGDGTCELIAGGPGAQAVFAWSAEAAAWKRLPFALPKGTAIVDGHGRDAGLRLVDLNGDGRLDVVFSNADRYLVCLYVSADEGWSKTVRSGKQAGADAVPMIVRGDGTNNGAWFKFGQMWVQNEETGGREKPSQAVKRSYAWLISSP